jgi:hypothetical protein
VVSSALLSVWAVLIGYRAVQITHHLSWQRAAIATLVPVLAAGLLAALLGGAFALGLTAGGLQ